MDRSEKAEFTNMCMIYDNSGNVLIQDKKNPDWGGVTFPGGHVEPGESFVDSVVREIREETGLIIKEPQLCGVKQFQNRMGARYVVFLYKTNQYSGDLTSSIEGEVKWVALNQIMDMNLVDGMDKMLQVYLQDQITELYYHKEDTEWFCELK